MVVRNKTRNRIQTLRRRFTPSIGVKLFLAFQIVILLTGLIGLLAMQRFNSLTSTTTELNTHDLPEVVTLSHIRTLLFQERDLEWSIVHSDLSGSSPSKPPVVFPTPQPTPASSGASDSSTSATDGLDNGNTAFISTPSTASASVFGGNANATHDASLIAIVSMQKTLMQDAGPTLQQQLDSLNAALRSLAMQRTTLLTFEPPDSKTSTVQDTRRVLTLTNGIVQAAMYSAQLQQMVKRQQFTQAQLLQTQHQDPLLTTILGITSQLRTLEQQEASTAAGQVQQESSQATTMILGLTAAALLISLLLALLITRSLTRPLSRLLVATKTIAGGDLDHEAQITRHDEIGRLAESFETMRLSLRSTIAMLGLEQRRTQAIIDANTDGVILVDASLRILQSNPSVERLSGWQAHEVVGKRWCELFAEEPLIDDDDTTHLTACSLCHNLCHTSAVNQTSLSSLELSVKTRNGQQRWFAIGGSPLAGNIDDQERRCVINIHDITQLKAVEQMKTDFVAMVSHELRAPVTTVTGSVEMLNMLDPQVDQEAYHEVLSILEQQTRRLRNVVQEVLQLTRFEAGSLSITLRPLPLITFLEGILDQIRREWADERTIIFVPQIAETLIWADQSMLEIVLRNLFDNARKYTPSTSPVVLSLLPADNATQVQLRLDDNGPGIPEELRETIFERFSRGRHTSANWNRGYGLGLYITRELLRAHNGTIWVENRVEGGASFHLCLCIADSTFLVDEQRESAIAQEKERQEQKELATHE